MVYCTVPPRGSPTGSRCDSPTAPDLPRTRRRGVPGRRPSAVPRPDRRRSGGRVRHQLRRVCASASSRAARAGLVHVPINYALRGEELSYLLAPVRRPGGAGGSGAARRTSTAFARRSRHRARDRTARRGRVAARRRRRTVTCRGFDARVADDDLVQLLYTSGTTSKPKGAMMTHGALVHEYVSSIDRARLRRRRQPADLHAAVPLGGHARVHAAVPRRSARRSA